MRSHGPSTTFSRMYPEVIHCIPRLSRLMIPLDFPMLLCLQEEIYRSLHGWRRASERASNKQSLPPLLFFHSTGGLSSPTHKTHHDFYDTRRERRWSYLSISLEAQLERGGHHRFPVRMLLECNVFCSFDSAGILFCLVCLLGSTVSHFRSREDVCCPSAGGMLSFCSIRPALHLSSLNSTDCVFNHHP